jgi:hypothetical protein
VKQKRNDDGTIQFRVRGISLAAGNLLNVPYDVSVRTASLDTVKLLIHSVISGNYSWMTIDIADFYLGTPLPAARYEYLCIHADKIPTSIMDQYNLTPLLYNRHVYFEIRKRMYGLPQSGKIKPDPTNQAPQHSRIYPMREHPLPIPPHHSRHHVLPRRRRFRCSLY